jgi:hypothetical protein
MTMEKHWVIFAMVIRWLWKSLLSIDGEVL